MEQEKTKTFTQTEVGEEEEKCFCDKKQCLLGIASIAIGIGGFLLATMLSM